MPKRRTPVPLPLRFTLPLLGLAVASPTVLLAQVNVLTWHNDNARTGQNLSEKILTPSNVNSSRFGALFQVKVDGKVDAEPLYVSAISIPGKGTHNVVYAATEHDSVYAIDADTGTILWRSSLLGSGEAPSDPRSCGQITPEIGITATPVIDLAKGILYATAMSKDSAGHYIQRVHGLFLATGADEPGSPINVQASTPGTGDGSDGQTVRFDPGQYVDRPGLLLVGSTLYTSWGSHCDVRPYAGWMMAYDTNTGAQSGVIDFTPNGNEAAPWNAGAGPAADAAGNVYISLGNGTFDSTLTSAGFPNRGDFGNSVVKLGLDRTGLHAVDYWTMFNSNSESGVDADLGSGGLLLLPGSKDSRGNTRNLAVTAGKDTNIYVMDQANLGKFNPGSNASLYQELAGALSNGMWSSPAYYNGHVYYGSVRSVLRSFDVNNALLSSSPSSSTGKTFGYPGTTPSVSAFGNTGIVWAVENSSPAVLHAFDANNLATELYNSNQAGTRDGFGPGNKFITPTIANGKVYVGTQNSVAVFGLLRNANPPLADGDYNLTNGASNLLLTDYATSTDPNTEIIQFSPVNGNYQTWFFSWQGNGYYQIQNPLTGLFLSSGAGGTTAARHLDANYSDAQLWSIVPTSGGYTLRNKATGLVLSNPGANKNPTGLQLQTAENGAHQVWVIGQAK